MTTKKINFAKHALNFAEVIKSTVLQNIMIMVQRNEIKIDKQNLAKLTQIISLSVDEGCHQGLPGLESNINIDASNVAKKK